MNDSVFHRLYEQYHQDVFRFLIYLTRNRAHAEDLVHEVYVRVLRNYENFKGESSEKTWLFSIAKNIAIDYFRKQTVRRKYAADKFDFDKSDFNSPEPLIEEFVTLNEEMNEVLQALETCSENQKMVIHLRYLHDLSIMETAEILNWSASKVKTTQHRAIKALQQKLSNPTADRGDADDT